MKIWHLKLLKLNKDSVPKKISGYGWKILSVNSRLMRVIRNQEEQVIRIRPTECSHNYK